MLLSSVYLLKLAPFIPSVEFFFSTLQIFYRGIKDLVFYHKVIRF